MISVRTSGANTRTPSETAASTQNALALPMKHFGPCEQACSGHEVGEKIDFWGLFQQIIQRVSAVQQAGSQLGSAGSKSMFFAVLKNGSRSPAH